MSSIVWIEWTDAVGGTGWTQETVSPSENITVGFIVHEDEAYIEVATTLDTKNGYWNSTMSVPKNMIIKRDTLNLGWGPNAS